MSVPESLDSLPAKGVQFPFSGLDDLTTLAFWGSWAVLVSCREGAAAVGASGFSRAVGFCRACV